MFLCRHWAKKRNCLSVSYAFILIVSIGITISKVFTCQTESGIPPNTHFISDSKT